MDMRICGKGNVPSGEYQQVSIRGTGRLFGKVRCFTFRASGKSRGESIECAEKFKTAGTASFSEHIKAKQIRAAGSLSCGGDEVTSSSDERALRIKCDKLSVSGSLGVSGDIEAEHVKIAGVIRCDGLLNAESIELQADKAMYIGGVGGSKIVMRRKRFSIFRKRGITVSTAIEGDDITLEYVTCPKVTGRVVVIGKGCRIDRLEYSEKAEISPKASVRKIEKI